MAKDNKTQSANGGGVAFGITSLATGVVAFLVGWIFFLSIPIGAVAIVFGALGIRRPASKGMAIAGLVTGIVGLAFGVGILVFTIIGSLTAGAPSVQTDPPMFYRYY